MRPVSLLALVVGAMLAPAATGASEPFVAGVAPDRRPADAPRITEVRKGPAWYDTALHGITPPYPWSLRFLEDQGNWFTPFNHPGMTGPYDVRSWH